MTTHVHVTRAAENAAIQILTVDRPPRNAMTLECYRQLLAALQAGHLDTGIECVILTGAGDKAFISGGDLNEHAALDAQSAQLRTTLIRQVFDTVRRHRAPVIAAVNGYALGGGLALMASCDIAIASTNAKFGLPEVKVGIMGGTKHLARIVPSQVARWMALTGRFVDAEHFLRLGALQEVVPPAELMAAAIRTAQEICQSSPSAIRLMKETLNLTEAMPLDDGYQAECLATAIMKSLPDGKEAVQAMLEKRTPNYQRG
ncbi:MAG: enoyl-CoA hydratase/isomerase family protein [Burkholderiaceae bacterium]